MVLNIADFDKCQKSSQTLWNVAYMRENGFLTVLGVVRKDSVRICKGPKSTDFEQKAWAIAHGFEHGRFWQVLEIAPNSMKRRLHAWKWISNGFWACTERFRENSQGSEIDRFWAKTLGYSPWFWKWPILTSARNRPKPSETWPICVKMDF